MGLYRKKPVEIEAFQLTPENVREVAAWCGAESSLHSGAVVPPPIFIPTLEGVMRADAYDWIIKEPFPSDDRKFYPCKPDIFSATYDAVEEEVRS